MPDGIRIQERLGTDYDFPLAPTADVRQAALIMLAAGVAFVAAPGPDAATAATHKVVGIAQRRCPPGTPRVPVRSGVFHFRNSPGADAITLSDWGQPAYVVADDAVALTDGGALRPAAGTIVDVDAAGVWVRVGR